LRIVQEGGRRFRVTAKEQEFAFEEEQALSDRTIGGPDAAIGNGERFSKLARPEVRLRGRKKLLRRIGRAPFACAGA
jgi:hypothetical protein